MSGSGSGCLAGSGSGSGLGRRPQRRTAWGGRRSRGSRRTGGLPGPSPPAPRRHAGTASAQSRPAQNKGAKLRTATRSDGPWPGPRRGCVGGSGGGGGKGRECGAQQWWGLEQRLWREWSRAGRAAAPLQRRRLGSRLRRGRWPV